MKDISILEAVLEYARGDGPVVEFFVLQDLMSVTGVSSDSIRDWYVVQLTRLQEELVSRMERRGVPYQVRVTHNDNLRISIIRVRALLEVLME